MRLTFKVVLVVAGHQPRAVKVPSVRLNISLPEPLVQRIDAVAQRRGQSRSAFLALATVHEMA